jgi:hypothetical protein
LVNLHAHVEVHLMSSAPTANYYEIVSQRRDKYQFPLLIANWEEYEDLLELPGKPTARS